MKKRFQLIIVFVVIGLWVIWLYTRTIQVILKTEVTAWNENQKADCAVVLTGGSGRVREGFDLLTQGRVRKLIVSGVYPQAELRDIFPQWPFYGPLNPEDVILEKRSGTTYGNAQQSQPYIEALRCKSVILVTSRLHMHRSLSIFREVLPPDVEIVPRAIVSGAYRPEWHEIFVEATKTIFYNIWAY